MLFSIIKFHVHVNMQSLVVKFTGNLNLIIFKITFLWKHIPDVLTNKITLPQPVWIADS